MDFEDVERLLDTAEWEAADFIKAFRWKFAEVQYFLDRRCNKPHPNEPLSEIQQDLKKLWTYLFVPYFDSKLSHKTSDAMPLPRVRLNEKGVLDPITVTIYGKTVDVFSISCALAAVLTLAPPRRHPKSNFTLILYQWHLGGLLGKWSRALSGSSKPSVVCVMLGVDGEDVKFMVCGTTRAGLSAPPVPKADVARWGEKPKIKKRKKQRPVKQPIREKMRSEEHETQSADTAQMNTSLAKGEKPNSEKRDSLPANLLSRSSLLNSKDTQPMDLEGTNPKETNPKKTNPEKTNPEKTEAEKIDVPQTSSESIGFRPSDLNNTEVEIVDLPSANPEKASGQIAAEAAMAANRRSWRLSRHCLIDDGLGEHPYQSLPSTPDPLPSTLGGIDDKIRTLEGHIRILGVLRVLMEDVWQSGAREGESPQELGDCAESWGLGIIGKRCEKLVSVAVHDGLYSRADFNPSLPRYSDAIKTACDNCLYLFAVARTKEVQVWDDVTPSGELARGEKHKTLRNEDQHSIKTVLLK